MPKRQEEDDDSSQDSESTTDSHLCCCLCYCAIDYSDKEAFYGYEEDSDDEENAKPKPLLLPKQLYDAQNALVLCDSCDRPYHQRCHFVPVVSLPRGDWHCLLCKDESEHNSPGKGKRKKQVISTDDVYPFPPKDEDGELLFDEEKQREWEFASSQLKAVAWKREFARLQRALSLQLQTVRLAEDSIRSHTTSSRKTHTISNPLKSQELCQCFVRLATSKLKVRQWMLSLEKVRTCWNGDWNMVEAFLTEHSDQQDAWFPYGRDLQRRVIPRCGHEENLNANKDQNGNDKNDSEVPTEVVLNNDASTATKSSKKKKNDEAEEEEDDDDMISLDDLQCCICFVGDASDENDVILCDGENCFRAYHMNCVSPHVTLEQVEEEDDWFCPICTAMAKLVANIQSEYTGDDWKAGEDDASTIASWDRANDVFPEAEKEYEMAIKWKEGQQDAEMAAFISNVLGMPVEAAGSGSNAEEQDDEDDSEDEDFDLNDLEKQKKAEEQDDESDNSSKASLGDLSDVEGKIHRSELDALSLPSDEASDDDDDDNAEGGRRRTRSARSSRAASANNSSGDESSASNQVDVGTLDESNIVPGKRRRSQVDYRRLNDSMFGDTAEIDDADEFRATISSRRNSSTSNSSSDEEESGSEDESSASGSGNDGTSSQDDSVKQPTMQSKKRSAKNLSSDEDGSDDSRKDPPSHTEKGRAAKKNPSTRSAKKKQSSSDDGSDDGDSNDVSLEQKQQRKKPVQKKVSGNALTNGRKRQASRKDLSEGSSSDGGTPNGRNRKRETWNEKSPTSINGKKNRRSKRAKWTT